MRTIFFFFLPFFLFFFDILNEISREMCFTREKRSSPTEIDINPNTCFQSLCFNILALIVFSKKNESPFVIDQKKNGITIRDEERNPSPSRCWTGHRADHPQQWRLRQWYQKLAVTCVDHSITNERREPTNPDEPDHVYPDRIGSVITQKR